MAVGLSPACNTLFCDALSSVLGSGHSASRPQHHVLNINYCPWKRQKTLNLTCDGWGGGLGRKRKKWELKKGYWSLNWVVREELSSPASHTKAPWRTGHSVCSHCHRPCPRLTVMGADWLFCSTQHCISLRNCCSIPGPNQLHTIKRAEWVTFSLFSLPLFPQPGDCPPAELPSLPK